MRTLNRLSINCANCGAKIYCGLVWPTWDNPVHADWNEPPNKTEKCPTCGSDVDTTEAYPYIEAFPPKFNDLKNAYEGFAPAWEYHRKSFERTISDALASGQNLHQCQDELNTAAGAAWFKQRMFYRSATGFYRSLQLFLAYLTLDRHCYRSWADVTAYYSRFYFIQAFLNLALGAYLNVGKGRAFVFFDGARITCIAQDNLPPLLKRKTSHDIWWSLMEAMKMPDYPCVDLGFILSRLVFNPERRQEVNYDYNGRGFSELNWFDSGWEQMLNHFTPQARADEDITSMNRFFGDRDPDDCDVGDFYGDDAQIIWCSLVGYLQFLKSLGFAQSFITTDTILALAQLHIGDEYPKLLQGIAQATSECLQDGFDLAGFSDHPNTFFSRR